MELMHYLIAVPLFPLYASLSPFPFPVVLPNHVPEVIKEALLEWIPTTS